MRPLTLDRLMHWTIQVSNLCRMLDAGYLFPFMKDIFIEPGYTYSHAREILPQPCVQGRSTHITAKASRESHALLYQAFVTSEEKVHKGEVSSLGHI